MSLRWDAAVRSDVGKLREGNEDSAYAGPRLVAVADGMGGHAAGEVASAAAIASLLPLEEDDSTDLGDALRRAVLTANDVLHDMVAADNELSGMGTTLTAAITSGTSVVLVHVGDSRAYRLRDDAFEQLTHDHTFVQQLVDEGQITADDVPTHPQRSLILRVLDGRPRVDLDVASHELRAGDRYLLCSDGLSGVVRDPTLHATLREAATPTEAAERLVDLALRGGAPDNVTVVVADVVETDEAAVADVAGAGTVAGAAQERPIKPAPRASRRGAPATTSASVERSDDSYDDDPHDGDDDEPRGLRRGVVVGSLVALLLALSAGGTYAFLRSQYYVGVDGDAVVIYRGLKGEVAGLSLSKVYRAEPGLTVEALSEPAQEQLRKADVGTLSEAEEFVSRLRRDAEATTGIDLPGTDPGLPPPGLPGGSATASPTATPAPSAT